MPLYNKRQTPAKENPVLGINTRNLSTVPARNVDWIWWQRIPLGKLTILSGDPDKGKTFVALYIIACLTTGRKFVDGHYPISETNKRRKVLWVSAEDEDSDTIVPRLKMLKADLSNVESLSFVYDNSGHQNLNVEEHIHYIDTWLQEHPDVSLIVLDPLPAFLGKRTDSYKNAEVRGLLTPLSKLAAQRNVSVLGINHLSKGETSNSIHRSMGSVAFVAAARSSWLIAADPKNPQYRRHFAPIKNNNKSEATLTGLAFYIGPEYKGITWELCTDAPTADDVLNSLACFKREKVAPARNDAEDWLKNVLGKGPVRAEDVLGRAKAELLCVNTIRHAAKRIGILIVKTPGKSGNWVWRLPTVS